MNPPTTLTPREIQCVKLCAECLTAKEIAAKLGIPKHTVDCDLSNVRVKLGMTNQKQLIHYALHYGLTENLYSRRENRNP